MSDDMYHMISYHTFHCFLCRLLLGEYCSLYCCCFAGAFLSQTSGSYVAPPSVWHSFIVMPLFSWVLVMSCHVSLALPSRDARFVVLVPVLLLLLMYLFVLVVVVRSVRSSAWTMVIGGKRREGWERRHLPRPLRAEAAGAADESKETPKVPDGARYKTTSYRENPIRLP